jgi:hypothetical protein
VTEFSAHVNRQDHGLVNSQAEAPPAVFYDSRSDLPAYAWKAVLSTARVGPVVLVKPVGTRDQHHPNLEQVSPDSLPGLSEDLSEFETAYQHWSSSPPEYEKACFERFIAANRLCQHRGLGHVWHLDTDAVAGKSMFSNEVVDLVTTYDLVAGGIPQPDTPFGFPTFTGLACIKSDVLQRFSLYVRQRFFGESEREGKQYLQQRLAMGLTGGVCDMTAWATFLQQDSSIKVLDTSQFLVAGSVALNSLYGFTGDNHDMPPPLTRSQNRRPVLAYRDGSFSLELETSQIDVFGVHFSGADKQLILGLSDGWTLRLGGNRHVSVRSRFRIKRKVKSLKAKILRSRAQRLR